VRFTFQLHRESSCLTISSKNTCSVLFPTLDLVLQNIISVKQFTSRRWHLICLSFILKRLVKQTCVDHPIYPPFSGHETHPLGRFNPNSALLGQRCCITPPHVVTLTEDMLTTDISKLNSNFARSVLPSKKPPSL
jgi:hypothetical protein